MERRPAYASLHKNQRSLHKISVVEFDLKGLVPLFDGQSLQDFRSVLFDEDHKTW